MTQDALHTDEPSPSIAVFEDSLYQREAGYNLHTLTSSVRHPIHYQRVGM